MEFDNDWPRRFGFTARFGRVAAETIGQGLRGALAECLKHCAGYARNRLGRRAQNDR